MRPTKNRYFCRACGHAKILFKTQEEADNYIRFNTEEIKRRRGYAPVRSYYCNLCFGYHVTSKANGEFFESFVSEAESAVAAHMRSVKKRHNKNKTPTIESMVNTMFSEGHHREAVDYISKVLINSSCSVERVRYAKFAIDLAMNVIDEYAGTKPATKEFIGSIGLIVSRNKGFIERKDLFGDESDEIRRRYYALQIAFKKWKKEQRHLRKLLSKKEVLNTSNNV